VVIRSGAGGLGEWHSERRNLYQEAQRAYDTPPRRVVGVWLIAVSLFRHGTARAHFADIVLASRGRAIPLIAG
jgi:hypothetical protein